MKPLSSLGLRFDGERLEVLDQRALPDDERWLDGTSPYAMAEHIRVLSVRGAPLIGVSAALALGCFARKGNSPDEIRAAAAHLRAARPTAVNLMAAVDRLMAAFADDDRDALARESVAVFDEDVALCEAMAHHGAALFEDGDGVLTHCNTGGLATVGVGTALGVIRRAWELGRRLHVYVDETRPLLQGARLTAWELDRLGIPHTLITDSMAPLVMRAGKVRRVLVGADRIARNGDFANKVGTYGVAVAARFHGVDFHPVAPFTTVDLATPDGGGIPIEEREAHEVRGAAGAFGAVRWAPDGTGVYNPSFDVTPVELVTSLVLDRGVVSRDELQQGALATKLPAPVRV
jgi:methylthioribose-1-phosphate isomerase